MAKMTMQQELEKLQAEVERLKKEQSSAADGQSTDNKTSVDNDANSASESIDQEMPESLNIPGVDKEIRQQIHDLIKQLGEEYENLSPATVMVIFVLGALFGRSLSSR